MLLLLLEVCRLQKDTHEECHTNLGRRVNDFIFNQAKRYSRKGRIASVGSRQPGANQSQLQDRFLLFKVSEHVYTAN